LFIFIIAFEMKKTRALLVVFALLAFIPKAEAEVFVWQDPVYKIRATFPDNWMRQAQRDDDMRLSILGPQGADHAACRLYAVTDGLFADAPPEANQDVSNFVFNTNSIKGELLKRGDVANVTVVEFTPVATLGHGAATLSYLDFQKSWAGGVYDMRAMMLASQYNGKRIIMSCEASAAAWAIWEPTLKSIIKSVDFPAAFTVWPNGHYRPFQNDGRVYFPVNKRGDAISAF
jgi:hypothetical protein